MFLTLHSQGFQAMSQAYSHSLSQCPPSPKPTNKNNNIKFPSTQTQSELTQFIRQFAYKRQIIQKKHQIIQSFRKQSQQGTMSDSQFQDLSSMLPNSKLLIQLQQKKVEIRFMVEQINGVSEELNRISGKCQYYVQQIRAKDTLIRKMTDDSIRLSKKIVEYEQRFLSLNQELLAAEKTYEQCLQSHLHQKATLTHINQNLYEKLSTTQETLGNACKELVELHKAQDQKSLKWKQLQSHLFKVQDQLVQAQSRNSALTQKNTALENENKTLNQRISSVNEQNTKILGEKSQEIQNLTQKLSYLQGQKQKSLNQIVKLSDSLIQLRRNTEHQIHGQELTHRKQLQELDEKVKVLNGQLTQKQKYNISLLLMIQKSSQEGKAIRQQLKNHKQVKKPKVTNSQQQQQLLNNLQQRQVQLSTQLIDNKHRITSLQIQNQHLQTKLTTLQSRDKEQQSLLSRFQHETQIMRSDIIRQKEVSRNLSEITRELGGRLQQGKNKEFGMSGQIIDLKAKVMEYEQVFQELRLRNKNNQSKEKQVQALKQKQNANQPKSPQPQSKSQQSFNALKKKNSTLQKQLKQFQQFLSIHTSDMQDKVKQIKDLRAINQELIKQAKILRKQLVQQKQDRGVLQSEYEEIIQGIIGKKLSGQKSYMMRDYLRSQLKQQSPKQQILKQIKQFILELAHNMTECKLQAPQREQILKQQKSNLFKKIEQIFIQVIKKHNLPPVKALQINQDKRRQHQGKSKKKK